jgi:hypothetical protein
VTGTLQPKGSPSTAVRGLRRASDPRVWGTTVGAVGASVFVMVNRGELAHPWPTVAVIVWVVALIAYTWFVYLAPRAFDEPGSANPHAGIIYLCSVVSMLVLIRGGTMLLDHAGTPALRPALIVMAVGLHFLPFAAAFHTSMFKVLGSVIVVLGTAGLALGWLWDARIAATSAVVCGVVMLVLITADAARSH